MSGESGRLPLIAAMSGFAAVLGWALISLPRESGGLADAALDGLPRSGVANPVTAALLNYRAYDTLLEMAVLLLAVVAVWAMARADRASADIPRGPVLRGLARTLTPILIVSAGHILWIGTSRPGGAFQSGTLLGGAGVLLILAYAPRRLPPEWLARLGLAAGTGVFLAVGAGVMTRNRRMLEYPPEAAGALILLIETAAALSIGLSLVAVYLGGRPVFPRSTRRSAAGGEPDPQC